MTLNEEDLEFLDRIGVDDRRMKIIKENQEKAEKWDKHGSAMDVLIKRNKIVERLKKHFNGDNVLTKSEYKQKILEGKENETTK